MKKILGVSLVALMAVSTARADIVSKAYVDVDQTKTYNVITKTAKTGAQIEELDAKMGALPANKTVAQAITEAVSGGTENVVTHDGAVGTATQPVYITSGGVATAGTALGTMAYEAATDYTPTTSLGSLATKSSIANADVANDAAIADSKISATGSIASGNGGLVTGGTVYTALQDYTPTASLDSTFATDTELSTALADYTPTADLGALADNDTISNADVASDAAIDLSKIAMPSLSTLSTTGTVVLTAKAGTGAQEGQVIYAWETIQR